jgi:hypothetical protein
MRACICLWWSSACIASLLISLAKLEACDSHSCLLKLVLVESWNEFIFSTIWTRGAASS